MFDSSVIDFAIGMAFFYVILTLICTMINEYFMSKVGQLRQKILLEGISGLFYDGKKVFEIYNHALVRGLYRDQLLPKELEIPQTATGAADQAETKSLEKEDSITECMKPFEGVMKNLPSYIPSRTFAMALLDILAPASKAKGPQDCPQLRQAIIDCGNERIKGALLPLIDAAQNNVEKARQNIEKWFDDSMDRVSGWFKVKAKIWLVCAAAIICFLLNADSIMIGKLLWQNKALSAAVAAGAEKYVKDQASGAAAQQATTASEGLPRALQLSPFPLGWVLPGTWKACLPEWAGLSGASEASDTGKLKDPRQVPTTPVDIMLKLIGLFFTTLAVSLGAPFWTDLLNSFVNLRRAGKVPAKAGEEKT